MIAKKYKLPIQSFPGKRGKLVKNSYFTLKIFSAEKKFSRFGVTVSAKTAPKAVKRNELKRVAYSVFGGGISKISVADYWLTISSAAAGLPKEEFVRELTNILYGSTI